MRKRLKKKLLTHTRPFFGIRSLPWGTAAPGSPIADVKALMEQMMQFAIPWYPAHGQPYGAGQYIGLEGDSTQRDCDARTNDQTG